MVLVGGAWVYAASGLWFMPVPGTEPAYLMQWLPGLLLSGLGVGLVLPALAAAAVSRLPAEHDAVGSAVNQATRQIGMVMGVALTVLLIGHPGVQRGDFMALYALHVGLALVTALCCLPVGHAAGEGEALRRRESPCCVRIERGLNATERAWSRTQDGWRAGRPPHPFLNRPFSFMRCRRERVAGRRSRPPGAASSGDAAVASAAASTGSAASDAAAAGTGEGGTG